MYIYGNFEINRNKKILKVTKEKIFVKIISPSFDLEYNLDDKKIENRFKKLVKYSSPDKNIKTLFIWPEGVFSGRSYEEVLNFKSIISKSFSKEHHIINLLILQI